MRFNRLNVPQCGDATPVHTCIQKTDIFFSIHPAIFSLTIELQTPNQLDLFCASTRKRANRIHKGHGASFPKRYKRIILHNADAIPPLLVESMKAKLLIGSCVGCMTCHSFCAHASLASNGHTVHMLVAAFLLYGGASCRSNFLLLLEGTNV